MPIVPGMDLDECYDPNEELKIGKIFVDDDRCILKTGNETGNETESGINLKITAGSRVQFAQEVVRMTSSSFQSVGDVTHKLIMTPDVDQLLLNAADRKTNLHFDSNS